MEETSVGTASASSEPQRSSVWTACGHGLAAGGRAALRAAAQVGRAMSTAYFAVDPDVRRHVGQLPLVGLTLLSRRSVPLLPRRDDGRKPVVFVHGLAGHPGNFSLMRRFFAACGRTRTYAFSLDTKATMESNAEGLRDFIKAVFDVNDLPTESRIDIIAHSMGGLVVRLALEDPWLRQRVAAVITLGTPHDGTHAARFGGTETLFQLRPRSSTVAKLAGQVPWPDAYPRLVALWSESDVLLLPASAACAQGAENVEMKNFTHYTYLLHPESWHRVLSLLG